MSRFEKSLVRNCLKMKKEIQNEPIGYIYWETKEIKCHYLLFVAAGRIEYHFELHLIFFFTERHLLFWHLVLHIHLKSPWPHAVHRPVAADRTGIRGQEHLQP